MSRPRVKYRDERPLAKYVQRVVTRGKEYFYFQLHRGTAKAGLRISLNDPHSTEEVMRAYEASCSRFPLKDPRGEIRRALNSAKMRCTAAGKPFHLNQQILEEMLANQNFRCAVSGLPFEQGGYDGCHMRPFGISIDQINPSGGYTAGNVRLVCKITNFAMGQWGEGALEKLALAVTSKGRSRTV